VDPNYAIGYVAGTVTVAPATLTVTASSATFTQGGAVPAIAPSYAGFVNGDTAASLTTVPTCSTTATSSSPPGTYPATCSGAVDANYDISYTAGTVTVTAGPVPAPAPGLVPSPAPTTTTPTAAPPATAFPDADLAYPDGAIVTFGGSDYVLAGGRAFAVRSSLAAVEKVDHAKVQPAPAGTSAPTTATVRPGTLLSTRAVNGDPTIYVAGTDDQLHGFSTSAQFFRDGYDAALVVTVPSLGGVSVGASAGQEGAAVTALATRADGAICDSAGTFYVFAGGRAFGISTPAALAAVRTADRATPFVGAVATAETSAAIASGVLLSAPGKVYVSYQGGLYLFKSEGQLAVDGYGGTGAVPVPGTGALSVFTVYTGA
jgi:MBG domain (YGX type)